MNEEPEMPPCPAGRRPHAERVSEINLLLKPGMTAVICIDNTEIHKAWYLHELAKYPTLKIVSQSEMHQDIWLIKVRKERP